MTNFFLAFAAFAQLVGSATFPDDAVTWTPTHVAYVDDALIVYDAEPSADVGCDAPRFVVDHASGELLAVYCDGELLAH